MKKSRDGKPGPWCQYPKRMLMWRAIGFHMDDHFSDVMMGFHIAEALDDYPEERVVTTMEPLDEPAKDPLLDKLQAEAAENDEKERVRADAMGDIKGDEILMAETEELAKTMQPPEEEIVAEAEKPQPEDVDPAHGAEEPTPMTEAEAKEDLVREGSLEVSEEDVADADPNNAAPEGADNLDLF
jgi:hypothetical protein